MVAGVGLLQPHALQLGAFDVELGRGQGARVEVGAVQLESRTQSRSLDQLRAAAGEGIPDDVIGAHSRDASERRREGGV